MNPIIFIQKPLACALFCAFVLFSCTSPKREQKEEQIRVDLDAESDTASSIPDSLLNSVRGNVAMSQISTSPSSVVLTGQPQYRLVTVYKSKEKKNSSSYREYDYDYYSDDRVTHYMTGIDILYGYNLLNIALYDLKTEKLNYLFNQPALIKTVYYPSEEQDSAKGKPVTRDYFLVSVYDQDTNKDTLINKKDLRRIYHFNAGTLARTQLIPSDYSVVRSQYDWQNDLMYIFARQDTNKNGFIDKQEPMHIFYISLKNPDKAKMMY